MKKYKNIIIVSIIIVIVVCSYFISNNCSGKPYDTRNSVSGKVYRDIYVSNYTM